MSILAELNIPPPPVKPKGGGGGDESPAITLAFLVAQMIACKGRGQASMLLPYVIEPTLVDHPDAALIVAQVQVECEEELADRVERMDAAGLIRWRPTDHQTGRADDVGDS